MLKLSLVQLIDSLLPQVGLRSSLRWVIWAGLQSGFGGWFGLPCSRRRPPGPVEGALDEGDPSVAARRRELINSCPSPMEAATSNPVLLSSAA